jgi:hypothetical protein
MHVVQRGCGAADAGVPAAAVMALPAMARVRAARAEVPERALTVLDEISRAFDAQCGTLAIPVAAR